jgi:transposase-like protein
MPVPSRTIAIHHAPSHAIRSVIGTELRVVWNAKDLNTANAELRLLVQRYANTAPDLSQWLERNVPEGLAVFTLPEHHQLKMRTSNPIERTVQQEIKRRTVKVRVFPSTEALLRLVSAILVEIDEKWAASTQPYIKWKANAASTP